jgi:hypothetical protein
MSVTVTSDGIETAQHRLRDPRTRVVGWGTGSVFDYFYAQRPMRLDALVDNDAGRWGQRRHGITIQSPECLRDADPARLLVVIYSGAWMEIAERLRAFGPMPIAAVPASALFAGPLERGRLKRADALAAADRPVRQPSPARSIVVQGPILPGVTPTVLRALAALHTNELIVLSTWRDTDPALLDDLRTYVDEVVLSDVPQQRGIQNRNCQLTSTQAGIGRARACGARTILKTRTDLVPLAPHLFDQAEAILHAVDQNAARRRGLENRLLVPASFTRKYLLYHPSDMVMLGTASDMALYWDAPPDPREGNLLGPEWMNLSLIELSTRGNPTESYLGNSFARRLGWPQSGTVEDSWAFYRDLFVVVDNDQFELLWLKNLALPDADVASGPRQLVHHAFWQRLLARDPGLAAEMRAVDPGAVGLRDLSGLAA